MLVVDDDDGIVEAVSMLLDEEGYEVLIAPHGAAALDVLDHALPDIILLDLRMPVMDGWTFLREYRQRPGPLAPVIIFTAAQRAIQEPGEFGAEAYLAKPFDIDDLLGLVGSFVRQV